MVIEILSGEHPRVDDFRPHLQPDQQVNINDDKDLVSLVSLP